MCSPSPHPHLSWRCFVLTVVGANRQGFSGCGILMRTGRCFLCRQGRAWQVGQLKKHHHHHMYVQKKKEHVGHVAVESVSKVEAGSQPALPLNRSHSSCHPLLPRPRPPPPHACPNVEGVFSRAPPPLARDGTTDRCGDDRPGNGSVPGSQGPRVSFFWLLGGSVLRRRGVLCRDQEGFYLCHLRFQEWVRGKYPVLFLGGGARREGATVNSARFGIMEGMNPIGGLVVFLSFFLFCWLSCCCPRLTVDDGWWFGLWM